VCVCVCSLDSNTRSLRSLWHDQGVFGLPQFVNEQVAGHKVHRTHDYTGVSGMPGTVAILMTLRFC
jgi:hypothetical protein